ncbi:hypothetical protein FQR65_LT00190 [Abscondita terminalis]|nr:hypothetical protein FQR65_LT00190 [Abscondita terminalis]
MPSAYQLADEACRIRRAERRTRNPWSVNSVQGVGALLDNILEYFEQMKLSVSAYRAHASAHKKILDTAYQLNYGSTSASQHSHTTATCSGFQSLEVITLKEELEQEAACKERKVRNDGSIKRYKGEMEEELETAEEVDEEMKKIITRMGKKDWWNREGENEKKVRKGRR